MPTLSPVPTGYPPFPLLQVSSCAPLQPSHLPVPCRCLPGFFPDNPPTLVCEDGRWTSTGRCLSCNDVPPELDGVHAESLQGCAGLNSCIPTCQQGGPFPTVSPWVSPWCPHTPSPPGLLGGSLMFTFLLRLHSEWRVCLCKWPMDWQPHLHRSPCIPRRLHPFVLPPTDTLPDAPPRTCWLDLGCVDPPAHVEGVHRTSIQQCAGVDISVFPGAVSLSCSSTDLCICAHVSSCFQLLFLQHQLSVGMGECAYECGTGLVPGPPLRCSSGYWASKPFCTGPLPHAYGHH